MFKYYIQRVEEEVVEADRERVTTITVIAAIGHDRKRELRSWRRTNAYSIGRRDITATIVFSIKRLRGSS